MHQESNPIKSAWSATKSNNWGLKLLGLFFLFSTYFGTDSVWNGLQGRCDVRWDTNPPYSIARQGACISRDALQFLLPDHETRRGRRED